MGVGPPLLLLPDFDTPPQQMIQAIDPHMPIKNSAVLMRERKNIFTALTKKFDDNGISLSTGKCTLDVARCQGVRG